MGSATGCGVRVYGGTDCGTYARGTFRACTHVGNRYEQGVLG